MKSLIIISLLFFGCIQDPEECKCTYPPILSVNDTIPVDTIPLIKVRYETSAHTMDVQYCNEKGVLAGEFNTYKFEKELYIEEGKSACISIKKLQERNNIYARVYIYVNDSLVVKVVEPMSASARYEL